MPSRILAHLPWRYHPSPLGVPIRLISYLYTFDRTYPRPARRHIVNVRILICP